MTFETRFIKVVGTGALRAAPDTIELSFALSSKGKTYEEMLHASNSNLEAMQQVVKKAGFQTKELRTVDYKIHAEYEYLEDVKRQSQRVFAGYVCDHNLLLKFPLEISKLHAVLNAADLCKVKPEFHIAFVLKDAASAKEEALKMAAIDAKKNAELLIGSSSNAHLGEILTIEERGFSSRSSMEAMTSAPMISAGAMQPDNITVEVSAEFVWEIIR